MIIVHSICTARIYIIYIQELLQQRLPRIYHGWMDFWGDSAHLIRWYVFLTDQLCSTDSRSEGKMVWIPRYQGPSSPGVEYDLQYVQVFVGDIGFPMILRIENHVDRGRNSWIIPSQIMYCTCFCLVPKNHPSDQLLIVLRDLGWPLRCIGKKVPSVLAAPSQKKLHHLNHRLSLCCMLKSPLINQI